MTVPVCTPGVSPWDAPVTRNDEGCVLSVDPAAGLVESHVWLVVACHPMAIGLALRIWIGVCDVTLPPSFATRERVVGVTTIFGEPTK